MEPTSGTHTGFWVLVCYAATHLATQLQQRCIQVVCTNKEARKCLTELNYTDGTGICPFLLEFGRTNQKKHQQFVTLPLLFLATW